MSCAIKAVENKQLSSLCKSNNNNDDSNKMDYPTTTILIKQQPAAIINKFSAKSPKQAELMKKIWECLLFLFQMIQLLENGHVEFCDLLVRMALIVDQQDFNHYSDVPDSSDWKDFVADELEKSDSMEFNRWRLQQQPYPHRISSFPSDFLIFASTVRDSYLSFDSKFRNSRDVDADDTENGLGYIQQALDYVACFMRDSKFFRPNRRLVATRIMNRIRQTTGMFQRSVVIYMVNYMTRYCELFGQNEEISNNATNNNNNNQNIHLDENNDEIPVPINAFLSNQQFAAEMSESLFLSTIQTMEQNGIIQTVDLITHGQCVIFVKKEQNNPERNNSGQLSRSSFKRRRSSPSDFGSDDTDDDGNDDGYGSDMSGQAESHTLIQQQNSHNMSNHNSSYHYSYENDDGENEYFGYGDGDASDADTEIENEYKKKYSDYKPHWVD